MNPSTPVYLRVAVPLALNEGTLTYRLDPSHLPAGLAAHDCAGCRVHVTVRRRPLIGLVVQVLSEPDIDAARVQPIEGLIDSVPVVNHETLSFLEDVARYYRQPIGQITHMSLPRDSLTFTVAWSARASKSTSTRESRTLFTLQDRILELLAQADEPMEVHAMRDALAVAAPTDQERVTLKSLREALDQLDTNGRVEKHRVCKTRLSVPHPAIEAASHTHSLAPATARNAHTQQQTPPPAPPSPPNGRVHLSAEVIASDAVKTAHLAPSTDATSRTTSSAAADGPSSDALTVDLARLSIARVQTPAYRLSDDQRSAAHAIMKALDKFGVHVMHGVTGSGKTDVYLRAIAAALNRPAPVPDGSERMAGATATGGVTPSDPTSSVAAGGDTAPYCPGAQGALPQVLVLVPEISLAPQWQRRLQEYIDVPTAITHYKVGDKLRAQAWADAVSGRVRVLIGTRSSVFIPFANLRLIVLDEEHAHLYKEADKGSYHARDVAVWRAQRLGIPVVLGSATPSCATWHNLGKSHFHLHSLPKRAEDIGLPRVGIIDLRAESVYSGFSRRLLDRMRHCLDGGRQVMIYHNSRGYAPALYCTPCARVISCRNCKLALHVHKAAGGRGMDFLWCHRCLARASMARGCPDCGGDQLSPLGISTQQIEQVVRAKFSEHACLRLDSDSITTSARMQSALREINEGTVQILIGTQMLVKGHHFPGVGLVAVLQPDAQLFSSDLYARERLVQDLVQVAGRSGREQPGEVVIQTRYPDEPLYAYVRTHNYLGAMKAVLDERRAMQLPPYMHLAIVRFADAHEERLLNRVRKLEQRVRAAGLGGAHAGGLGGGSGAGGSGAGGHGGGSGGVQLYAPVLPAVTYYRRLHRAQAWLLATNRPALGRALDQMISVCRQENIPSWSVDIDPVSAE